MLSPFVSVWRNLPAPSFIPILLMWFGTGEAPKLALLFLGVIFFLITLIADHTKEVRKELIETALTPGAGQGVTVPRVMLLAVLPNIVTAMRQMLAIAWTYLVIAEIVASPTGIGAMMMPPISSRRSGSGTRSRSSSCPVSDGWNARSWA